MTFVNRKPDLDNRRLRQLLSRDARPSNAERRDPLPFATQEQDEERPRNVNGREQVNQQPQHQRDGETADWSGAERVKKQRRNNSRHVSIDDRHKGVTETLLNRRRYRLAG